MKIPVFISRAAEYFRSLYLWFIRRKLAIAIFIAVTLALPAYAMYLTVFRPLKDSGDLIMNTEVEEIAADSTRKVKEPGDEIKMKIGIVKGLEYEKAFLQNRVYMARNSDSVCMSVDLQDSVIYLEIKGVVVRTCPLRRIETGRKLSRASHSERLEWVSTPFYLAEGLSTIPKIPYVIKEAPRDTTEAQEQSAHPLPVDTTSVYFTLFFERGLVLEVVQTEPPHPADRGLISKYYRSRKKLLRKKALRAAFRGQAPEQEVYIRLEVSQADARAIYRGIPVIASLSLGL